MKASLLFYHCEICKRPSLYKNHNKGMANKWICPRCYRAYVQGADDHAEYNDVLRLKEEVRTLTLAVIDLKQAIERMGGVNWLEDMDKWHPRRKKL